MGQTIIKRLQDEKIEFVDFRFTDFYGNWHHMTYHASALDAHTLEAGIMFDGSSIAGWRPINDSDMILKPDAGTAQLDPFSSYPTLILTCDVVQPDPEAPYTRDPRSIAKKAEAYLKSTGIADQAFFGPEPEFFVFDHVEFDLGMNHGSYRLDSQEGPYNSGEPHENLGHRPGVKGGYVPVSPVDTLVDMRAEMLDVMESMGLEVEKHHHEVAPSQHELGYKYGTLVQAADQLQIYKYVVKNVAHSYGKSATFMPKPIMGDNGSGMHVHQSLWLKGAPTFLGNEYGGLSELALYYIGGIIEHARAINAFTNPTTNSYKRLVPGYEAPVVLAYSSRNRSASIRVPHVTNEKARRIEVRFPDAASNPYLGLTVMLMAGLDGIKNKIHPGKPTTQDLYHGVHDFTEVSGSLRESLEALEQDHDFLLQGDVFTKECIGAYIALKMEEVHAFEQTPHPLEFKLYYSA